MKTTREPAELFRGKAFHKKIQHDWQLNAEGTITVEKPVRKPTGSRGRIDIHADSGDALVGVGVGEVEATDWDRMSESAVQRNVRRQAKQIWAYIESQLVEGHHVSPGVIFPARPKSKDRLKLVGSLFDQEGIAVVWDDETLEERKARAAEEGAF